MSFSVLKLPDGAVGGVVSGAVYGAVCGATEWTQDRELAYTTPHTAPHTATHGAAAPNWCPRRLFLPAFFVFSRCPSLELETRSPVKCGTCIVSKNEYIFLP